MTFTAGNLFHTHSCIGWSESSPHRESNPGPQHEKHMTYQVGYPSQNMCYCLKFTKTFSHERYQFRWFMALAKFSLHICILRVIFLDNSHSWRHFRYRKIPGTCDFSFLQLWCVIFMFFSLLYLNRCSAFVPVLLCYVYRYNFIDSKRSQ